MKPIRTSGESQTENLSAEEFRAFARRGLAEMVRNFSIGFIRALLEEEISLLCGIPAERKKGALAYRGGSQPGWVVMDGQRVRIDKPRARRDGREIRLSRYGILQSMDNVQECVESMMLAGVSTRGYAETLDGFPEALGLSKSTVSRQFVKTSRESLNELNSRPFPGARFWAIFLDGMAFGGSIIIVALGVDDAGKKHILGVSEGSTENHETVLSLLRSLREREIEFTPKVLVVQDGSRAIEKAVGLFFAENAEIQLCYLHKLKNILGRLPKKYHSEFVRRYRQAYAANSYEDVMQAMTGVLRWLETVSHAAAESLREGFDKLLTLHRIGMPPALRKSFYTTNPIDSAFSNPRSRLNRNKRVRGNTDQGLRWVAAHLLAQEAKFRRIKSYALITQFLDKFLEKQKGIEEKKSA